MNFGIHKSPSENPSAPPFEEENFLTSKCIITTYPIEIKKNETIIASFFFNPIIDSFSMCKLACVGKGLINFKIQSIKGITYLEKKIKIFDYITYINISNETFQFKNNEEVLIIYINSLDNNKIIIMTSEIII